MAICLKHNVNDYMKEGARVRNDDGARVRNDGARVRNDGARVRNDGARVRNYDGPGLEMMVPAP